MGKKILTVDSWIGGKSHDKKDGLKDGFQDSQSIDFRKRSSRILLQPKTVKESGSTVDTPVTDMVRVPGGDIYMMGESKIYKRSPESQGGLGSYSVFHSSGLTQAQFGVFNRDRDKVYVPDGADIHVIDDLSGTPTMNANQIGDVLDYEVNDSPSNTYTLPTSISESDTDKLEWQPEVEPLIKVAVYVVSKGTGDVTLTVHDAENNVVASKTVTNANLTAGDWSTFEFATPARIYVKPNARTYHVHATVSTGTTTVKTATSSDFSTAEVRTYANRLVDGVPHIAYQFLQYVCITNERYLAVWEPITDDPLKTEFEQHRLKLPPEYTLIGVTEWEEYLVLSAYKSVSSDYGDDNFGVNSTEGLLLFWDGTSKTYNYFKKIPAGAFESITTHSGLVWGIINGVLHVSSGDLPVPLYVMPGVDEFTSSADAHDDDVYLQSPYKGMTVDKNVLSIGFPMLTANDNIKPGVYSYGSTVKDYPESFGFDGVPSHGDSTIEYDNSTPPVPLSGVTYHGRFGANKFVAWQHGDSGSQTYGIDVIKRSNDPYSSGSMTHLRFDDGMAHKEKLGIELIAVYDSLPSGTSVTLEYAIDGGAYEDGVSSGKLQHNQEDNQYILTVDENFHFIDLKVTLNGNSNGTPEVISVEFIFDDLTDEKL